MNEQPQKTKTKSFILGTIIGAAVGVVLGVLYAPKKGEETRKELKGKTEDLKGKAKEVVKEGHQVFLGWSEQAQKAAKEISESISTKATKTAEDIKDSVQEEIEKKNARKPRYFKGIR